MSKKLDQTKEQANRSATACSSSAPTLYRIVNTCNFGKDYPDESFLDAPPMTQDQAKTKADILNQLEGQNAMRYWKVVESTYELAPGFEP